MWRPGNCKLAAPSYSCPNQHPTVARADNTHPPHPHVWAVRTTKLKAWNSYYELVQNDQFLNYFIELHWERNHVSKKICFPWRPNIDKSHEWVKPEFFKRFSNGFLQPLATVRNVFKIDTMSAIHGPCPGQILPIFVDKKLLGSHLETNLITLESQKQRAKLKDQNESLSLPTAEFSLAVESWTRVLIQHWSRHRSCIKFFVRSLQATISQISTSCRNKADCWLRARIIAA